MSEKKSNFSTFLLILLIVLILIMGYFMYNLYTTNQIETDKINNLNNELSNLQNTINDLKESIDKNKDKDNNNENDNLKDIILEGSYVIDASDVGYEFSSNSNVKYSSNLVELKGTYTTVEENEIEIRFTEKTVWDDMTNESTTTKINTTEKVVVVNKNTLTVTGKDNGEEYSYTIVKF